MVKHSASIHSLIGASRHRPKSVYLQIMHNALLFSFFFSLSLHTQLEVLNHIKYVL